MKKINLLTVLLTIICCSIVSAQGLFSIYNGSYQIDASNAAKLNFETLINDQKVFLAISATKLNSSFISVINSDLAKKKHQKLAFADIEVNNLLFEINGTETDLCDGSNVTGVDTNCVERECTITQRVVSKCNETDCWNNDSSTDRLLTDSLSESFTLNSKIEITDCVSGNIVGGKHEIKASVEDEAANIHNGGSIQLTLFLENESTITQLKR